MPAAPALGAVRFALRDASRPLLVLGPSLGTSVESLWRDVVDLLADEVDLVGWDLPGHGTSPALDGPASCADVTIAGMARDVLDVVDRAQADRGDPGAPFWYAGVSMGGVVGLQLLLDAPGRVAGAALLCTGARIGTPDGWHERADLVAVAGTPTQVTASAGRWFAPGFIERRPEVATRLLAALQLTDRFGYAAVCRALADYDVRDRLGEIAVPVLAVAGGHDPATPVALLEEIASGVQRGTLRVLDDVAHLAAAEAPEAVAEALRDLLAEAAAPAPGSVPGSVPGSADRSGGPDADPAAARSAGTAMRRAVLGDAHVDRAVERTTAFTADFQDLITRYAWGEIWTRPGLDRRTRSVVTLTALVAGGHWEELALHVRAARTNGLSVEEIREVLLQTAVYCSVPSANHAFAVANEVLAEDQQI